MGLDMNLYRQPKTETENIGYWRKANAILLWIESNCVGRAIENCEPVHLSAGQLEELRDACQDVIDHCPLVDGAVATCACYDSERQEWVTEYRQGKVLSNQEYAREKMPTCSGFFFGSTDYDEFYLADLKRTIEIVNDALDTAEPDEWVYTFVADW